MIRDFKPSLSENTSSKNLHYTDTSQRTRPTNQINLIFSLLTLNKSD